MKYCLILSTILIFSCTNSHEKSFLKLNDAFVKWYQFNNPSENISFNLMDDYVKYFRYYDQISIEEYLADVNRFSLELSQIKFSDLNKNYRVDYLSIVEKINQIYFEINILKKHENEPSFYVDKIKFLIKNIYNNKRIELDDKIILMSNVFNYSTKYIDHAKKTLKLNLNNKDLEKLIKDFIVELDIICNEILFYYNNMREIYNENKEVGFVNKYTMFKDSLDNYIMWVDNNIKNVNYDEIYNKQNINNFYKHYNYLYNDSTSRVNVDNIFIIDRLFELSLDIYLKDNDEPVWVDMEDTLNVVSWVINEHINVNLYNEDTFISKIDNYINNHPLTIDISKYSINNDILINDIISNCKYYNDIYLEHNIISEIIEIYVKDLIDKYKNDLIEPKYLFINEIFIKSIIESIELKTYEDYISFDKVLEETKILFYLNLYRDNIKKQYQEQYYNNIDIDDILKKIDSDILLEDLNKTMILKEVTNPEHYKLIKHIYKNKINSNLENNNYDFNDIDKVLKKLIINRFDEN